MSLSELTSFAISGSAATVISALATDRAASPIKPTTKTRRTAANGFVFFFSYYVAATTRFSLGSHAPDGSGAGAVTTRHAATKAFCVGVTAAFCARLFGPDIPPHEQPEDSPNDPWDRWSMPALEDDLVLALDPGLTFCLHEILARYVAQQLQKRQNLQGQQAVQIYHNGFVAAATTFLLAAASKAVAAGLAYPLYTAATAAAKRRWEPEAGGEGRASGGSESSGNKHSTRRNTILAVLFQILRADGVQALYVDWMRSVATAALGHGLTMSLQRVLYGVVLRLVQSLIHTLKARSALSTPASSATANAIASQREIRTTAPALPSSQPSPPADEPFQVTKAVQSWLESSTASSTPDGSDSIISIGKASALRSSRQRLQEQANPAASLETAMVRREGTRGLSRTATTVAESVGPASLTAASSRQVDRGKGLSHEFDDGPDGNLVFNMISKSPRIVKRSEED